MQEVRRRLQIFLTFFVLVTAIGTTGFMILEDLSFPDALYYTIVTISTVGYGDIHPTHQASRMFAVLLIVMGGATFLGVIANATEIFILRRESQNRRRKINMVLGIFFSEVGYKLLDLFSSHDPVIDELKKHLLVGTDWKEGRFANVLKELNRFKVKIDASDLDLEELSAFLKSRRDFLLGLLENPVIIEHEDFCDLLLSVFHLLEELSSRDELVDLTSSDMKHITGDTNRVYKRLVIQWVVYLRHLKGEYPYLFSLAVRTNPFDKKASPVVTE